VDLPSYPETGLTVWIDVWRLGLPLLKEREGEASLGDSAVTLTALAKEEIQGKKRGLFR